LRIIEQIQGAKARPSAGELTVHFNPEGECRYSLKLTRGEPQSVVSATEDDLMKFIAVFRPPLPGSTAEEE